MDCTKPALFTNRAAARFALFNDSGEVKHLLLALRDAERSISLDARWVKGYYRKGTCLSSLAKPVEAADAFRAGLQIDPKNEQIENALQKVEVQIANTPKDWEDAKTRGNESYRNGAYEDAIGWYTVGLDLLGVRLTDGVDVGANRQSDGDEKKEKPSHAAAPSKNIAALLANRAEARRQLSDVKACVRDCDLALEYEPSHIKAMIRRALAYEYLERFDLSAADFGNALKLDAGNQIAREGHRRVSAFAAKLKTERD